MKRLLVSLVIALPICMASDALAQPKIASKPSQLAPAKPVSFSMPEGFKDIYLGMTIASLKQVRRNVEADDPIDGGRKWSKGYAYLVSWDENAKNPFFRRATYGFDAGRLSNVRWQADVPKETLQAKRKAFLSSVVKLYGRPSLLKLATDGTPQKSIVIIWRQQTTLTYAQLTPEASFYRPSSDSPRADRGYILLSVRTGTPSQFETFINSGMFAPSSKAEVDRYLVPIQKEISRLLPHTKVVPIDTSSKPRT